MSGSKRLPMAPSFSSAVIFLNKSSGWFERYAASAGEPTIAHAARLGPPAVARVADANAARQQREPTRLPRISFGTGGMPRHAPTRHVTPLSPRPHATALDLMRPRLRDPAPSSLDVPAMARRLYGPR